MNRKQTSQAMTGMLLIVLGLIFLGRDLGGWPEWNIQRLWPLFLIVIGIGQMISSDGADPRNPDGTSGPVTVGVVTPNRDGKMGSGLWMIFLGGLFLLHTYKVATLHKTWPLFIVVFGLSLMTRRDRPAKKRER